MFKIKHILVLVLFLWFTSSIYAESLLKYEIIQYFQTINISPIFIVFILAMLPIFELRLAIPIGIITFGLSPFKVFIVAIIGNMFPIIFILLFLNYIQKILIKWSVSKKLFEKLLNKTKRKSSIIEKYEEFGLLLFVAIPLPITGAWTGSVAANILGLKTFHSFFYIFLGVVSAGVIVTTLTLMGVWGAVIAIIILLLIIFFKFIQILKSANNSQIS